MAHLLTPEVVTTIEQCMQEWHVPGFSIAIAQDEDITYRSFGLASLEPVKECTSDTIFDIASVSKSLTAAAVALLLANERFPGIAWDTPVSKIIPDFVLAKQSYTDGVTVEDILSHRSGLPSHDYCSMGVDAVQPDTVKSLVAKLRHLPLATPIRSKYMYCNLMYTVATHLVEQVSNQSFSEYLQEHFFTPLGMTRTFLQPNAVEDAGFGSLMATPYTWDRSTESYIALPHLPSPENQGAGLIFTSTSDYIKWVKAIMLKHGPITEEVYNGLTTPRIITSEKTGPQTSFTAYAAGWEIRYYRGVQIVQHDGLTTGFGSSHFFIPEFGTAGVAFGNSENANDLACLTLHLLVDEILSTAVDERPDWLGRHQGMFNDFSMEDEIAKVRDKHFGGVANPEALTLSLNNYIGRYHCESYGCIEVESKGETLYINCRDRSMPIILDFEHMRDQTHFLVQRSDYYEGPIDAVRAQFKMEKSRAVELGIEMESDIEELTWFRRV